MTDGPESRSTESGYIQQSPVTPRVTWPRSIWGPSLIALCCGSLILFFSLGIRHAFGLFLQPVTIDLGWGREAFAFGIALQNLVWGLAQPFTGVISDKIGAVKVVAVGALLYVAGLVIMATAETSQFFTFGSGILIGLGLSGSTFPVVFGTISRLVHPERRSLAMGIAMSVGSFGQFIMLPAALTIMTTLGWRGALIAFAAMASAIIPLSFGLREHRTRDNSLLSGPDSARIALLKAISTRDFWLLSLGFFVCGFQVVFIATHLPAFLGDNDIGMGVATVALALVGLVNIAGTYYAGLWGGRRSKPMLLSWIYLGRAIAIAVFVLLPVTEFSTYTFGIVMGLFWLSTVPLTNGTIAAVWGIQHMSMLGGIVFLAHQLGSFLGSWLGGLLYDQTGSYEAAWSIAIALSIIAALLNVPIREVPLSERHAEARS